MGFRPAFSPPTQHRLLVLVLAAGLTTGRRTVTTRLRTVRDQAPGHASSSPGVLSQRRWSAWAVARALITCWLDQMVPAGPVLLAGDDPVTEPPGPHVFGQGGQRAAVRSTHRDTAQRWGHNWGVVSGRVTVPGATRPWALPSWAAFYRPPAWERVHGPRPKTPAHRARLLLARRMRWLPQRHVIFVGDTGYGTSEPARCCRQHRRHLTLGRKFQGDAAVYAPPPPRTPSTIGRPRVKGQNLPAPQKVVAHSTRRTRLAVAWQGGITRASALVTGTGPWYRSGAAWGAGHWGYVPAWTGTQRDEYVFTTDLPPTLNQSVAYYTHRWSIDTTLQEGRAHLKLEATKCDGPHTV